jgi:predicted DNA-binding transcriptional regulator AlpA
MHQSLCHLTDFRTCFTHSALLFNSHAKVAAEEGTHNSLNPRCRMVTNALKNAELLHGDVAQKLPVTHDSSKTTDRGRGQPFTSSQFVTKKIPHSQKSAEDSQNGISGNLDDVFFLRLPEVKAITGLSKSSLYALIREKSFPAPVRIGARAVAWVRSEVRQWAAERVHASRSAV